MTNAEKFQKVFGYYATEMWAKPEKEFLEWINAEALEQKSKRGKWVDVSERGSWSIKNACDQCGEIVFQPNYNYCPNCGARMESDEE